MKQKTSPARLPQSLVFRGFVGVMFIAVGLWVSHSSKQDRREKPTPGASTPIAEPASRERLETPEVPPAASGQSGAQIPNVTIRDLNDEIVFRGTVDIQSTLDRIESGERLKYRNDGSVFENREGRLPRKRAGYYKEYVHPTHSLSGPGPQRLVVGEQDEVFYTPDHYRTFQRIR